MDQRLSVVTLGVADLDRSRRFYEALGWKVHGAPAPDVAFFQLAGGVVLALFARDALAEDAGVPAEGSGFRGIALAQNQRRREEVDAVIRDAERAGGTIVKPPGDTFWGGYAGYFADPDGHLWEIAHNPFWPLDERGGIALPP